MYGPKQTVAKRSGKLTVLMRVYERKATLYKYKVYLPEMWVEQWMP